MQDHKKIIDLSTVQDRTSCGRTFIYQRIKDGSFPQPIQLGARRIGFLESEIDEWIAARIAASRSSVKEVAA